MIRKMKDNEIDKIMKIYKDYNLKINTFIYKPYLVEDQFYAFEYEHLPISEVFVFEENNIIKGFITKLINKDLCYLYVDLKYKNEGIEKILLDYLKNSYKKLTTFVYKENIDEVNFYLKNDFKIILEQVAVYTAVLQYQMKWEK